MNEIKLDKLFRRDSAARVIAEMLLTGKPHSRQELSEKSGSAVTQVNRVVKVLESEGVRIERTIGDDGHQAIFRVAGVGAKKVTAPTPSVRAEVVVAGVNMVGENLMVDIMTEGARFRGQLVNLSRQVPVTKRGKVTAVEALDDNSAAVKIDIDGKPLVLNYVHPVED